MCKYRLIKREYVMPDASSHALNRVLVLCIGLLVAQLAAMPLLYGKPQAPVLIEYELPEIQLQPATQFSLMLKLQNTVDVDDLLVNVRLSEGLESASLQAGYNFGVMPKYQQSLIHIDLSAAIAGQYRLYVTAIVDYSGQRQSRVMVIPLLVGNVIPQALHKSSAPVTQDAAGRAIISMPAKAVSP